MSEIQSPVSLQGDRLRRRISEENNEPRKRTKVSATVESASAPSSLPLPIPNETIRIPLSWDLGNPILPTNRISLSPPKPQNIQTLDHKTREPVLCKSKLTQEKPETTQGNEGEESRSERRVPINGPNNLRRIAALLYLVICSAMAKWMVPMHSIFLLTTLLVITEVTVIQLVLASSVNEHVISKMFSFGRRSLPNYYPALRRPLAYRRILFALCLLAVTVRALYPSTSPQRFHPLLIPPKHVVSSSQSSDLADFTLRDFLMDEEGFYLAMAPAFFGFYGYFGALMAWEEKLGKDILTSNSVRGVAGGSAGAMAAILLATGIPPSLAANFCAEITVDKFADFPGILAVFRGNKFEQLMHAFMATCTNHSLLLEDALIPVGVTGFDLQTMQVQTLTTGSMPRAARASATFPFLFQPVAWNNGDRDFLLIDGGLNDTAGVVGLASITPGVSKRVVNLKVEDFFQGVPPGPSTIPDSSIVISISLRNLPPCGPWSMSNGPKAVHAAKQAMEACLDLPLYQGQEKNHFEMHIDASPFWQVTKPRISTLESYINLLLRI